MTKWVLALGVAAWGVALAVPVRGQEKKAGDPAKGAVVKTADLEDYNAKVGEFTVNNIGLKETPDGDNTAVADLQVFATVKNKAGEARRVTVMFVGLDADKLPVWTHYQVVNVNAMEQEKMEGSLRLPTGTMKGTAYVWVRVVPVK